MSAGDRLERVIGSPSAGASLSRISMPGVADACPRAWVRLQMLLVHHC